MGLKELGRFAVWALSLAVASQAAYYAWRRCRCRDDAAVKRRSRNVHEVIMFHPHKNGENPRRSKYCPSPQLKRVMDHLCCARQSLDVAIYVLTNVDLANVLACLVRSGVKVRCIVDADMAYVSGSQVRRLETDGIIVRWMKSTNLMHHKFCLLDANSDDVRDTPLLLTGSLNWTSQASNGNWENVLVTSQETLVALYKAEFDRLWDEFRVV